MEGTSQHDGGVASDSVAGWDLTTSGVVRIRLKSAAKWSLVGGTSEYREDNCFMRFLLDRIHIDKTISIVASVHAE